MNTQHAEKEDSLLTDAEHAAVHAAATLWNAHCAAIPDGPTRDADLRELIAHVHAIQHAVMANAAARAYPDTYRTLGGTLRVDPPEGPAEHPCSTWGCPGDGRYAAPGRRHRDGCRHPYGIPPGPGPVRCGLEFGDGYTCDLPKGHD